MNPGLPAAVRRTIRATPRSLLHMKRTACALIIVMCASASLAQDPTGRVEPRAVQFDSQFIREMDDIGDELQRLQPLLREMGVALLQELKELEQRPSGPLDEWAEALRRRYTSWAGILGAMRIRDAATLKGLSRDEREVQLGNVQKRLIALATSGRISKREYDHFVRRLQGQ
jgi:hypothetical protein